MVLSTFYAPTGITAVCPVALLSVDLFFVSADNILPVKCFITVLALVLKFGVLLAFFLHILGGMSTFCEQIMGKQFF